MRRPRGLSGYWAVPWPAVGISCRGQEGEDQGHRLLVNGRGELSAPWCLRPGQLWAGWPGSGGRGRAGAPGCRAGPGPRLSSCPPRLHGPAPPLCLPGKRLSRRGPSPLATVPWGSEVSAQGQGGGRGGGRGAVGPGAVGGPRSRAAVREGWPQSPAVVVLVTDTSVSRRRGAVLTRRPWSWPARRKRTHDGTRTGPYAPGADPLRLGRLSPRGG